MKMAPGVSTLGSRAALTAAAVMSANGAGWAWFFSKSFSIAGLDQRGLSSWSKEANALAWGSVINWLAFLQSNVPAPGLT